jgi:hypothetical protein
MTPAAFGKIALSLDGAVEGAHGGHADFRAGGKVFATLGYPGKDWGMVKLAPEQQMLVAASPRCSLRSSEPGACAAPPPCAWPRWMPAPCAAPMAWQNVTAPKPKKARRTAA